MLLLAVSRRINVKKQSFRGEMESYPLPFSRHCIVNTLVSDCHGTTIKLVSFRIIMIITYLKSGLPIYLSYSDLT